MSQDEGNGDLSRGCLEQIANGANKSNEQLILQVISVEKVQNGKRYSLLVHDCVKKMKCLLDASLNHLVEQKQFCPLAVVQVNNHQYNFTNGQGIIIAKNVEVLQTECPDLVNNDGNGTASELPYAVQPKKSGGFGGATKGFGSKTGFGAKKPSSGFGAKPMGGGGGKRRNFHPVKSLNPFMKDFAIKVRVTTKGNIRTWNNARGNGKLFSVNLIDSEQTEIQATCFNEACDQWYPVFEEGKVFVITKARVKISNKRYTHIPHEYNLDLGDAHVELAPDDGEIDRFKFDFTQISDIENKEPNSNVDIIGICTTIGDVQEFTSKKGNELRKRTISLVDKSGAAIECTFWGDTADKFPPDNQGKVVCLQAARVSDFAGKSLSSNGFYIEPEGVAEVDQMKQWWSANQGNVSGMKSLTERGGGGSKGPPISLAEGAKLGEDDIGGKGDYFTANFTVTQWPVKEDRNPWYTACPSEPGADGKKCNKKVNEQDGGWFCEKCDASFKEYIPRWIGRFKASDSTDSIWLGGFDDQLTKVLGVTAKEAEQMKEHQKEEYDKIFQDIVMSQFTARIRARKESYNDEVRKTYSMFNVEKVDMGASTMQMLSEIQQMSA